MDNFAEALMMPAPNTPPSRPFILRRLTVAPRSTRVAVLRASMALRRKLAGASAAAQRAVLAGRGQVELELRFAAAEEAVGEALWRADLAVIELRDGDIGQGSALDQAIERLGPYAVLVFARSLQPGWELAVRSRGCLLLTEPVSPRQWRGLLERVAAWQGRRERRAA